MIEASSSGGNFKAETERTVEKHDSVKKTYTQSGTESEMNVENNQREHIVENDLPRELIPEEIETNSRFGNEAVVEMDTVEDSVEKYLPSDFTGEGIKASSSGANFKPDTERTAEKHDSDILQSVETVVMNTPNEMLNISKDFSTVFLNGQTFLVVPTNFYGSGGQFVNLVPIQTHKQVTSVVQGVENKLNIEEQASDDPKNSEESVEQKLDEVKLTCGKKNENYEPKHTSVQKVLSRDEKYETDSNPKEENLENKSDEGQLTFDEKTEADLKGKEKDSEKNKHASVQNKSDEVKSTFDEKTEADFKRQVKETHSEKDKHASVENNSYEGKMTFDEKTEAELKGQVKETHSEKNKHESVQNKSDEVKSTCEGKTENYEPKHTSVQKVLSHHEKYEMDSKPKESVKNKLDEAKLTYNEKTEVDSKGQVQETKSEKDKHESVEKNESDSSKAVVCVEKETEDEMVIYVKKNFSPSSFYGKKKIKDCDDKHVLTGFEKCLEVRVEKLKEGEVDLKSRKHYEKQ